MPALRDAVSTTANDSSASFSGNHTLAATANLIYVVIAGRGISRSANGVTSITVGGVLAERIYTDPDGFLAACDVYRLISPPTGTQSIVATRAAGGYAPVVMMGLSVTGADIAVPDDGVTRANAGSATGDPYQHSRVITSQAGDLTVSAVSASASFAAADAGTSAQAEDIDALDGDGRPALLGTWAADGASRTHLWDLDADAGGREAYSVAWNVNTAAETPPPDPEDPTPPPTGGGTVADSGSVLGAVTVFEIWDRVQCAAGVRLAIVPDILTAKDRRVLQDVDALEFTIPASSPAAVFLVERRIVRTVDVAGAVTEWVITGLVDSHTEDGATRTVQASGIGALFSQAAVVTRTDANGAVTGDFEALALTATQHLEQFILPSLAAAGYPWFQLGTVSPVKTIDLVYEWSSPMDLLRRMAELTSCEWRLVRDGSTRYLIDLIPQIASAAPRVTFATGTNLRGITRTRTTTEQATRVYPRGADLGGGIRATMARNRWRVTAVVGNVLTLADPAGADGPVMLNDQWVGIALRRLGGTPTAITACSAADQTVTVADVTGFTVSQYVEFCINGTDLLYVPAPSAEATYGVVAAVVERPDIPETDNLLVNPAMRIYGGATSPPDGWGAVGSPTIDRVTDRAYWRTGGYAARMRTAADGQGLRTGIATILPTSASPYFSGYVSVWLVSGQIRVEMVYTAGATTRAVPDGTDGRTWTNQRGTWIYGGADGLGVAGINLGAVNATTAYMRVVQDGPGTAEFYVEAAQLTQTAVQAPFIDGSGGTQLMQEANRQIRDRQDPGLRYDIQILDLAQADRDRWNAYELILGGPVRVVEDALPVNGTTRLLEVARDLLAPALTEVVLSSRPEDLVDMLVRPRVPGRLPRTPDTSTRPLIDIDIRDVPGSPGQSMVYLTARPEGAQIWYVIDDAGAPVPVIGAADYVLYASPFPLNRLQDQRLQIAAYAQQGGAFSEVQVRTIDRDTVPDVVPTIQQPVSGTARLSWVPDDDVVDVRLYVRVDPTTWPTSDGTVTGALDSTYFVGTIHVREDGGSVAANGTPLTNVLDSGGTARTGIGGMAWQLTGLSSGNVVRGIWVPRDRFGNIGARASASFTMTTGSTPNIASATQSALTDSAGGSLTVGETIYANLAWTLAGGASDGNHDLRISVRTNGGAWTVLTTIGNPVGATTLRTSTGYAYRTEKFDPFVTFEYQMELIQTSGAVVLGSRVTGLQETTVNPLV